MKIESLTREDEKLYFVCLEDWSTEMPEASDHKEHWYEKMKDKGLGVKLAKDDNGVIGGMIQYIPIEYSNAEGKDSYFINCIWVHGYKEGRGDFRKQGMGKALLKAAEDDVKSKGASGIAAWGVTLPFFMRAAWYKKQGYMIVDKVGIQALLWKPFKDGAYVPKWIRQKKTPESTEGKVTVSSFINGWCPAQNIIFERAKRASAEFGDKVIFKKYDTSDRETFLEWGLSDALYINSKSVNTGPPPSYDKIRKLIEKSVRKMK